MTHLNLFIIGPSGCGKSTQAKLVAEKYHLTHLSMGQLLRNEIAASSPEGQEAKYYLDNGLLVPEELSYKVLNKSLSQIENQDFIIDGFPRSLLQGKYIDNYLTEHGQSLDLVIHLDVTFDEIKARRERMGNGFQDQNRTDNTPEAIASRQKFYDDNNGPIMDYFQSQNKLFRVDGNRPIEPIFSDISQEIDKILTVNNN